MNSDELRAQLLEWLEELKTWYPSSKQKWEDYLEDRPNCKAGEQGLRIILYTNDHRYQISATTGGYLGCIVTTRKARSGETSMRGSDLPDGKFCREIWDAIIRKIVAYELVAKVIPKSGLQARNALPVDDAGVGVSAGTTPSSAD